MIRDTILTAFIAGLVAALFLTAVQAVWITPLILQAETYEEASEVTQPPAATAASVGAHAAASEHDHHHDGSGHHHDDDGWKPRDGWQRSAFTLAANLVMGMSYGLVLVAVFLMWRAPKNAAAGIAYGLAGFGVFFIAPALGLPPELPGTAAADLTARQEWWLFTAALTAVGLLLFFSQARAWVKVLALALIVAPHLVDAPHPAVEGSLAPAALQTQFRLATTVSNALFWLALGLASAWTFRRLGLAQAQPSS
jgi:cobalt transporter subunit CbtA